MRTHAQIIKAAGGPQALADTLGRKLHTVRSWVQRDAIPASEWPAMIRAELATMDELSPPRRARTARPEQADAA